MMVHICEGTSSPSCCNSALQTTAVDSKEKYEINVATTAQKFFNVDDLLKSVKDN